MGDPILEQKDFYAMHITDQGLALLTKVMAREIALKFTRVAAGDGYLAEDADPYKMTALVNHVKDLPISSSEDGGGVAVIRCYQTSAGLAEPYDSREIGLFALDPDDGEILYAYHNAGDRADFIPSEKSPVVVDWILALVTLVKRAATIEVNIDSNYAFVSQAELNNRIDKLFGDPAVISHLWTRTHGDDKKLRPVELDEAKLAILGGVDLPRTNRKVENLEDILAQVVLKIEANEMYPDYSRLMVEDFLLPDNVDQFKTRVLTVFAGDTSIDVEEIDGIIPLSWYTLTDGVRQELVCVKSINVEHGVRRIMLTAPVQHTYIIENTRLHRSSATIKNHMANGPIGKQTIKWDAGIEFRGLNADTPVASSLPTNIANAGRFNMTSAIGFTADGLLTLSVQA